MTIAGGIVLAAVILSAGLWLLFAIGCSIDEMRRGSGVLGFMGLLLFGGLLLLLTRCVFG